MHITFHAGAPRTGSTTIQRSLAERYIDSKKTIVVRPRDQSTPLEKHLLQCCKMNQSRLLGAIYVRKTLKLLTLYEKQGYNHMIITEEGWAGYMLGRTKGLYDRIDNFFYHVSRVNKSFPCNIVILVRKQIPYVISCFRFRVQKGYTDSAKEFFQFLNPNKLTWSHAIEKASEYKISTILKLVEFDQFIKNSNTYDTTVLPSGFSDFQCSKSNNPSIKNDLVLEFIRQYSLATQSLLEKPTRIEQRMRLSNMSLMEALEYIYGANLIFSECHKTALENKERNFPQLTFTTEQKEQLQGVCNNDANMLCNAPNALGNFNQWII